MPEHISVPQWRSQNQSTRYPFSDYASLINSDGRVLPNGVFLDAVLYPIGSSDIFHLANVAVGNDSATLTIGDPSNRQLASGTFSLLAPPDKVDLFDPTGRPAGVLVSEALRLSVFQGWGVGSYDFTPAQTEFAATVCIPTPQVGVRGILLDDGTLFTGAVWIVGADGVVVSATSSAIISRCNVPVRTALSIRVDVVGDPLFRRRLCPGTSLFNTPNPVKVLRVVGANATFDVRPDAFGNVRLFANNMAAKDTVLRIGMSAAGITFSAVGSVAQ